MATMWVPLGIHVEFCRVEEPEEGVQSPHDMPFPLGLGLLHARHSWPL